MSKSLKIEKIVFLFPSNAIKSKIVLESILEHRFFYKKYDLLFCFNSESGQNFDLAQKRDLTTLIVSKELKELENIQYDLLVSCGWGWKISERTINKAKVAALNCHSSYLPDYKGGSVYNYYWANHEKFAGASIHFLTRNFDEGNILTQEKIMISNRDKPMDILKNVSSLTAILIREAILRVENGEVGIEQKGGRYFFKTNRYNLYFHRIVNKLLRFFGSNKTFYTKYREVK